MKSEYTRPTRMLFGTAVNKWLSEIKVQESTKDGYRKCTNRVLKLLGDFYVKDYKQEDVKKLLNITMLNIREEKEGDNSEDAEGREKISKGKVYSFNTRKNTKSVLKRFFEYLQNENELKSIPNIGAVKLEKNLEETRSVTLPYSDEVIDVLENTDLSESDRQVADVFIYNCKVGERPSELIPMKRSEYKRDKKIIRIGSAVVLGKEKVNKTSKSSRKLTLCSSAANIVEKHVKIAEEWGQDAIFLNPKTGRRWDSVSQLSYALKRVFETCGIGHLYRGIQPSRHTFVTKIYDAGMTLDEIAAYIGHSSPRVLDYHYLHWESVVRGKKQISVLEEAFG